MRSWPVTLILALCQAAAWAPRSAVAAESSSNQVRVDELQKSGVAAFQSKRYEEALQDFEQAYRLDPRPLLLGSIAKTYLDLGRCGEAVKNARLFGERAVPHQQAQAQALRTRIQQQCSEVTIETDPPGARLLVDGRPPEPPGPTPWTGWLKEGNHTVAVNGSSLQEERLLHVPSGEHAPIKLRIEPTVPFEMLPPDPAPVTAPVAHRPGAAASAPTAVPTPAPPVGTATPLPHLAAPQRQVPPTAVEKPFTPGTKPIDTMKSRMPPAPKSAPVVTPRQLSPATRVAWKVAPWASLALSAGATAVAAVDGATYRRCPQTVHSPDELVPAQHCLNVYGTGANVAIGVAGASAIASIVLFLVRPPMETPASSPPPVTVGLSATSLSVQGRF